MPIDQSRPSFASCASTGEIALSGAALRLRTSRRSLVESYGCSVMSEIVMVAAETAVSPAAAAWFAAEKAAHSGMPGTSLSRVSVCRLCVAFSECGSVL